MSGIHTTEEFIETYRGNSDEELYKIHLDKNKYSQEAHKALYFVVDERGGLELLERKQQEKLSIEVDKKILRR